MLCQIGETWFSVRTMGLLLLFAYLKFEILNYSKLFVKNWLKI